MLALLPLAAAVLQHGGQNCHRACMMDGYSGKCQSGFCGSDDAACCKQGLVQPPCDGTIGCRENQCCTALEGAATPAVAADDWRAHGSPAPAPPPDPPLGTAVSRTDASEDHCAEATLSFALLETKQVGSFHSSNANVGVEPWQDQLRVILLIRSRGTYIEVMEVDGARLEAREQTGAFLRLTFRLEDEPTVDCDAVKAACFGFSTIGDLDDPESLACAMPAEFVDPPPSPPPRYVSKGELAAQGLLLEAPFSPPPSPPVVSHATGFTAAYTHAVGSAASQHASATGSGVAGTRPAPSSGPHSPSSSSHGAAHVPGGGTQPTKQPAYIMMTLLGVLLLGLVVVIGPKMLDKVLGVGSGGGGLADVVSDAAAKARRLREAIAWRVTRLTRPSGYGKTLSAAEDDEALSPRGDERGLEGGSQRWDEGDDGRSGASYYGEDYGAALGSTYASRAAAYDAPAVDIGLSGDVPPHAAASGGGDAARSHLAAAIAGPVAEAVVAGSSGVGEADGEEGEVC